MVHARQVAGQIAVKRVFEEYGADKTFHSITYHRTVKLARSFSDPDRPEGIGSHIPGVAPHHVNGTTSTRERRQRLDEFKEARWSTVSNARCLNEGIDVPAVDLVAFMDPKRSRIDIVQAAGRAMRLSPETGKTCGYILLPVFLDMQSGESLDEALLRTGFDEVEKVLQALAESDSSLAETIRELREEIGRNGEVKGGDGNLRRLREKVKVLGPVGDLAWMHEVITVWTMKKLIEKLSSDWDAMYGRLQRYKDQNGDCNVPAHSPADPELGRWVNRQRTMYKKGLLSEERTRRLTDIGFEWDDRRARWKMRLSELRQYYEQTGDCNPPQGTPLGDWCATQRERRRGKGPRRPLTPEEIAEIDAIGGGTAGCFNWNPSPLPPASKDPKICRRGHVGCFKLDSEGYRYCAECARINKRERHRVKAIPNYQPGSIPWIDRKSPGSFALAARTHCKCGKPFDGISKDSDGRVRQRYCKACKRKAAKKRDQLALTHCPKGHRYMRDDKGRKYCPKCRADRKKERRRGSR
jgi:helicase associated protein/helicase-like protein